MKLESTWLSVNFLTRTALCLSLLALFASDGVAQCAKPGLLPMKTLTVPSTSKPTAVADVNGDGKSDLAVLDSSARTTIYLGLGDGGFVAMTTYLTNAYDIPASFGDLNGDGKPEMLIIERVTGNLGVWMNSGAGEFTLANSSAATGVVAKVADLNGDGKGDLISFAWATNFNIRLGNGAGGFSAPATYAPAVSPQQLYGVFPGDFNGDGKLDIAAASIARPNSIATVNLKVYLNDGSGAMVQTTNSDLGTLEVTAAGDLNGDGKFDLVGVTPLALTATLLINGGAGSFTPHTQALDYYPLSADYTGEFSVGDFDGDGKADVLLGDYYPPQWQYQGKTILFGDGTGGVSYKKHVIKPNFGTLQGDFNNDGKIDFLETAYNQWANEVMAVTRQSTCNMPGETRKIDFDGDGRTEYAVFRPSNGNWYQHAVYSSFETANIHFGAPGDVPAPGDFDGDGKTDLAVFRPSTGDWYVLRSADGSYTGLHFGQTGDRPVPGDYDGDGRSDIAIYRPESGVWYQQYSSDYSVHGYQFGISTDTPVPADFDGDAKTDVAVFRPSLGIWYLINSATNTFTAQPWGSAGDLPVAADYDGDNRADITIFRPSGGMWYALRSSNSTLLSLQHGAAGDVPVPGFAGSGYTQNSSPSAALPVVYRPTTGYFYAPFSGSYRVMGATGDTPVSSPYKPN